MGKSKLEERLSQAVGARVAQLRKERRVTQEQLAERVGVAPQTIRRIERGTSTPPLGRLLDIASALGIQLMVLFEDADAAVPPPTWDTDEARVVELYRATPDDQRPLLLQIMACFTER